MVNTQMRADTSEVATILDSAIRALEREGESLARALDEIPVPVYVTDVDGVITRYNRACIDFAGRTPRVGQDSWCVTWKLYTEDGQALPHDQCPMAVAIREKRPVRGVAAVAERPDGTKRNFMPYPTPLLDRDGNLAGAVNIFIDVTDRRQAELLREQAARCLRLARWVSDRQTLSTLHSMAAQYEARARELEQSN